jgi:hypothetical protein
VKWLFWQTWMLLLASFLIGAFVTWLYFVRLRGQMGMAGVMSVPAVAPVARILGRYTGSSGPAPAVAASTPLRDAPAPPPEPSEPPDLDTPAIGIPVTTPAEPLDPDRATATATASVAVAVEDGGFGGNSDDTLVLAADVAAGRPPEPAAATPACEEDAVTESPYGPGSALPVPGGSAPSQEYRIKGNADSMLYHTADSPYFTRTRPEVWFRTEEDAMRAGFHPWNRRVRQAARTTRMLAGPAFEDGRYPGSAKPHHGGAAPSAEFTIKGSEESMVYHTPTSPSFGATVAEVWFRSEADARRAGFTAWYAKVHTS